MARCAVPARVVAGGTSIRATLTFEGVAPLHAARTSQRDVPTTLNTYVSCVVTKRKSKQMIAEPPAWLKWRNRKRLCKSRPTESDGTRQFLTAQVAGQL